MMKYLFILAALVALVHADCYMHNPRGSNNRMQEPDATRNNDERLFDSQNNQNGGYCWGPKMYYYVGSQLSVEWTAQHSCGQQNNDCDIIIQYMCGPNWDYLEQKGQYNPNPSTDEEKALYKKMHEELEPRDGIPYQNTNQPNTPDYCQVDENANDFNAACNPDRHNEKDPDSGKFIYGLHEPYSFYHDCFARSRHTGLYVAGNENLVYRRGATATRQDPGGNEVRNTPSEDGGNGRNHGYECPEERDYYPYWSPQPWKDIAILTTRTQDCSSMAGDSQNINPTYFCYMDTPPLIIDNNPNTPDLHDRVPYDEDSCLAKQGTWRRVKPLGGGKPECLPAPWSRDNHLGNGITGHAITYNWTIPNDPNPSCVLRIRYNITTKDGQWNKRYSTLTAADGKGPVSNDPTPWISANTEGTETPATAWRLELAIDTTQFGRTFQDRSHVFEIRARDGAIDPKRRIYNLNVRGRRGNIVQAYPAVEYDFVPSTLNVKTNDYIHIQWTGCDNGYPDNQAGEGRDRTDRSNMLGLLHNEIGGNIPHTLNDTINQDSFFSDGITQLLAWIGQTNCLDQEQLEAKRQAAQDNNNDKEDYIENCGKLNGAPTPYFDGGLIKIKKSASWNYISSRNNNFSNRSQKGVINSEELVQTFGIVLLSIAGAGFLAAVGIAVVVKVAPSSALAAATTGV